MVLYVPSQSPPRNLSLPLSASAPIPHRHPHRPLPGHPYCLMQPVLLTRATCTACTACRTAEAEAKAAREHSEAVQRQLEAVQQRAAELARANQQYEVQLMKLSEQLGAGSEESSVLSGQVGQGF